MKQSAAGIFLVFLLCPGTAAVADTADSVYLNGRIYTVNEAQPWAEAMAVQGDKIALVGSNEAARKLIGASTRVTDLHGRMVMPGIHDAHTHLLWASMHRHFGCVLAEQETVDSIVSKLKQCAKGKKKSEWLLAGMYQYTFFPNGKPNRKWLDQAFPDTPVYLREYSFHQALLNTKALEVAGIDKTTRSPDRGEIVKDENGELTGELVEEATLLASRFLPPESVARQLEALRWAVTINNQYGITSVQDAAASLDTLRGLDTLDRGNGLTLKVAAHLTWGSPRFGGMPNADLEALISDRAKYQTQHVRTDFVKMTIDGVPIPPYFTEAGIDDHCQVELSRILIPPDKLNEMVTRFDKAGIKVKMHVTGAGAARVALDAIEAARKANPQSAVKHDLAHTNIIAPQDMPRFKQLNAVGEMSPAVWQEFGRTLGNPPQPAWQFKTLQNHGVLMTVGSDWVVTPAPNLFPGLQGMLLRGDESVDLASALRMLTINGAIALGWEDTQGSIEQGKLANFIVLDRNLFEVPATSVSETVVLKTVFEGRVVYEAGESHN
jgi:predicted amidohydrolase YtcJ